MFHLRRLVRVYPQIEKEMLLRFFNHVNRNQNMKYMHWNMRDVGYQLAALEHRFTGHWTVSQLLSLIISNLIWLGCWSMSMERVISVTRDWKKLIQKNHITMVNFLTGAEEARAFEEGRYFQLHWSTLSPK